MIFCGFALLSALFVAVNAGSWVTFYDVGSSLYNPKLLTDGTILIDDIYSDTGVNSIRIGPDAYGLYDQSVNVIATVSLPNGYGPLYCGSAVLPDGRVVMSGGEYNFGNDSAIGTSIYCTWCTITKEDFH